MQLGIHQKPGLEGHAQRSGITSTGNFDIDHVDAGR